MTFNAKRLNQIYVQEIVYLHGVIISIISDRGSVFTSRFGRAFQEELGNQVELSITFYLQKDD